jgi:hypothetical protein
MKIILITLALMLTVGVGVSQAQTLSNNWSAGFGLNHPRFYSVNITSLDSDFGLYLSIQRNLSENVGLRFKGGYSYLQGQWSDASHNVIEETTNLITGDFDLLYYLTPCAPISPYLFAGIGGNYKNITNGQTAFADDNKFGSQSNIGTGVELKIKPRWNLVAEFGYHVTSN